MGQGTVSEFLTLGVDGSGETTGIWGGLNLHCPLLPLMEFVQNRRETYWGGGVTPILRYRYRHWS